MHVSNLFKWEKLSSPIVFAHVLRCFWSDELLDPQRGTLASMGKRASAKNCNVISMSTTIAVTAQKCCFPYIQGAIPSSEAVGFSVEAPLPTQAPRDQGSSSSR